MADNFEDLLTERMIHYDTLMRNAPDVITANFFRTVMLSLWEVRDMWKDSKEAELFSKPIDSPPAV